MTVIADTGALYALVDRTDSWHARVVRWWKRNRKPILVPITVLPEVSYLLQKFIGVDADLAFSRSVADGELACELMEPDDLVRAAAVLEQYADLSIGFVDASIVAVAERLDTRDILTTDRRDFGVVRPRHARSFALLP